MKGYVEKVKTKTKIFLKLAQFLGKDSYGNCYYESRNIFTGVPKKPRRWVLYSGLVEGSKVPALWHGWLHGYQKDVPAQKTPLKNHKPNLTGTGAEKAKALEKQKKRYHPWTP